MRGADTFAECLFTMRKLEDFVPARHPLREIRKMANAALPKLGPMLTAMYATEVKGGRPSIAPEKLLRAMLPASRGHPLATPANRGERTTAAVPAFFPSNACIPHH